MSTGFWQLTFTGKRMVHWDKRVLSELQKEHPGLMLTCHPLRPPGVFLPVVLTARRIQDFVWTGVADCLMQDHVLRMFQEQEFTGFEGWPVAVRMNVRRAEQSSTVNNHEAQEIAVPKLWELVITGWGGVARPESGVRLKKKLPDGTRFYSHYVDPSKLIDESQWDGSDFFMVYPMVRYIFVADRVARSILEKQMTGVKLVRVEEMPQYAFGADFAGGRLRCCLPEPQAREIGEPLGIC